MIFFSTLFKISPYVLYRKKYYIGYTGLEQHEGGIIFILGWTMQQNSFPDQPPSGYKWCNSSHSTLAGSALRSDCQPVKCNINSVTTTQTTQTVNNTQGSRLAHHTLPQMNANITLHCNLVHKIDFHGMSGHVSSSPNARQSAKNMY